MLPDRDTVCQPDIKPLLGQLPHMSSMGEKDAELIEALRIVGENYMELKFRSRGPGF